MFETNTKTRTVITWARCISSCLASIPFPFHGDDSRVFQGHVHDVEKADNLPGTKKKQKVGSQNFLPLMRCVPGNRQALCIAILCCLFDAEGAYGPSLLNIRNWIYAVVDLHCCHMLLQIFMTTDHRCRSKIWSRTKEMYYKAEVVVFVRIWFFFHEKCAIRFPFHIGRFVNILAFFGRQLWLRADRVVSPAIQAVHE